MVIIDEAYCDFGGESAAKLVKKYENAIVVSTFSKSRNLAGGRIGFVIANENLILDIEKMKYSFNPYSLGRIPLVAAKAAIEDDEYFKECVGEIKKAREALNRELGIEPEKKVVTKPRVKELKLADEEKLRCARENPLQFDSAKGYHLYHHIRA